MEPVKSVGISCQRIMMIAWTVLLVVATVVGACMVLPTIPKYMQYIKGQEKAIEIALADSGRFDEFAENNSRKSLAKEIFSYYNPQYVSYDILGTTYFNKEEVEAARKLDLALGEKMREAGFTCNRGSEYLQFSTFAGYAGHYITGKVAYAVTFGILLAVMLCATVFCFLESRKEIVLQDDAVLWKTAFRKDMRIGLRTIQRVEMVRLCGIRIRGSGFTHSAFLIQNRTGLYKAITGRMKALKQMRRKSKSREEFTMYQSLVDMGVMTQEELDG